MTLEAVKKIVQDLDAKVFQPEHCLFLLASHRNIARQLLTSEKLGVPTQTQGDKRRNA